MEGITFEGQAGWSEFATRGTGGYNDRCQAVMCACTVVWRSVYPSLHVFCVRVGGEGHVYAGGFVPQAFVFPSCVCV